MGKIDRVLIVAPTSVVAVWPKEFQEFADFKYTCRTLLGDKTHRLRELNDLQKFPFKAMKVAVINYESTWREGIFEALQEYDTYEISRRKETNKTANKVKKAKKGN